MRPALRPGISSWTAYWAAAKKLYPSARHWPQFRHVVVSRPGSKPRQRMDAMLPSPSVLVSTCSVSRAQPEQ